MSKSVGNIVDPFVFADKYGADALRYYLMSDIATGQGRGFLRGASHRALQYRPGKFVGNLLNRTLNMAHRYRDGRIRNIPKMRGLFVAQNASLNAFTNSA